MYDYREYCPIAKASELLGERWTLLIIRELLSGSTRFNQLRRYLPRISPTLLKTRLRMLEDEGLVVRVRAAERNSLEYELTESGRELGPVLNAIGGWSTRWQYEKFKNDEVHVAAMMRDFELLLEPGKIPGTRTILKFLFSDEPDEVWFVEIDEDHVEACDHDRSFDVDVYFSTNSKTLADLMLRRCEVKQAIKDRILKVTGSKAHIDGLARWFPVAPYVD